MNPPSPLGTATGLPEETPRPNRASKKDEPQAALRRPPTVTAAIKAASIPANRKAHMSVSKEVSQGTTSVTWHPIISHRLPDCQSFFRWEGDPTITELPHRTGRRSRRPSGLAGRRALAGGSAKVRARVSAARRRRRIGRPQAIAG